MNRRALLGLGVVTLTKPSALLAQGGKLHRLGFLGTTDEQTGKLFFLNAFLAGMLDLGYSLDRGLTLDIRYARGDMSRLPRLADELIALQPDVLLGIQPAVEALARKTRTIPIVMVGSSNPVEAGLVKNLARPGTNVTGMTHLYEDLVAKQIEVLADIVPKMTRVGLLRDSSSRVNERFARMAQAGAQARKLHLVMASAEDAESVRRAFDELKAAGAQGVVVGPTGTFVYLRKHILEHATRLRLPAIYAQSDFVRAGGLVSYGADLPDSYRRDVPRFVDRILRGTNPAEIAVQQPTKYELVVSAKAARSIDLSIPRAVLTRADRVIE
jgi:putative tryptophan/tyrosine transport system substrate-binding protein